MMKKILTLLTTILLSILPINSQNKILNGRVKSITQTTQQISYFLNGDKYVNTSEITTENFDSDKKIKNYKREIFYNNALSHFIISKYIYNNDEQIDYSDNVIFQNDSIHYSQYYSYKDDLLIKKSFQYEFNDIEHVFYTKYNYDSRKKLIETEYSYSEKYKDSNNKIRYILTNYYYDKRERVVKSDNSKSINYLESSFSKFKTNRNGLLIRKKDYNKANTLLKVTNYEYEFDNENNWILKKKFDKKDGLFETISREIKYYN